MAHEGTGAPRPDWSAAAKDWRQQHVPPDLVRELHRHALENRRTRPSALRRAWLPAAAVLVLLLVALALRGRTPQSILRADLRNGSLHVVWFQPISGERGR
jgi:hypothetical protein